jgi:Flp pilus assembly pilin Flp
MPSKYLQLQHLLSEDGQTMSEAAMLLALVVIVVMAAILTFGQGLGNLWSQLSQTLPNG